MSVDKEMIKILKGIVKNPKTPLFAAVKKYPNIIQYHKDGLIRSTPPERDIPSYLVITEKGLQKINEK